MKRSKFIDGYGENYSIDLEGNVYSHRRNKFLSQRVAKRGKGYLYVSLWSFNTEKKFYIHRLVAQAFVANPKSKATVNHIDGDTFNNYFKNLEWSTHQEQQDHAWDKKLTNNHGESCGTAKLSNEQANRLISDYLTGLYSQYKLADVYGINQSQVSRIVNKKRRANQDKGVKNGEQHLQTYSS